MRTSGFWVVSSNSSARYIIFKCVKCRYLRGKVGEQKMAEQTKERLAEEPPFTFCGVDMFGPFIIKERRSQFKRYGAMFTYLSSPAVHMEVTSKLDTDCFILALRRFIGLRGNIRLLYSPMEQNVLVQNENYKEPFKK